MTEQPDTPREQLLHIIERIEELETDKQVIADEIRETYSGAKGIGYDPAILRIVIKRRKMDPNERFEQDELLDTYMAMLGMLPPDNED